VTGLRRSLVVVRAEVRTRDGCLIICASPKVPCDAHVQRAVVLGCVRKVSRLTATGAVAVPAVPASLID